MKRSIKKIALTSALTLSLAAGSLMAGSAGALADAGNGLQLAARQGGMQQNGMRGGMAATEVTLAESASEIVTSTVENTAAALKADMENATVIDVTDENSQVKITESGTYVITGSASEGSVTVKKGTTGVVLVLKDLDLTSTTGAAVSVNKDSEVQIVVSGSVTLTDAEDPADENSQDAETAAAFDGAALKIKSGSVVYLTGDGTLNVNGDAKNGIKVGDTESSLVIDGENLTVNITAANDGINAGYDLTIAGGTVNVSANDDAIHADRILTVGSQDGSTAPSVTVSSSTEGLEGTVVNIFSGSVTVNSTDDAINAANTDGTYNGEMAYSINVTGGDVTINSRSDGLDSNGNVNLTGGTVTIQNSARNGGDAGIDYDGQMYVSDDATLNNQNGIAGPDQMNGMGGMNGSFGDPFGLNGGSGRMTGRVNQPDAAPTGENTHENGENVDTVTQATSQDRNRNGETGQFGGNGRMGQRVTAPTGENSQDNTQENNENNPMAQPNNGPFGNGPMMGGPNGNPFGGGNGQWMNQGVPQGGPMGQMPVQNGNGN